MVWGLEQMGLWLIPSTLSPLLQSLPLYDRLYYCSCVLASWFQWFFCNTLNPFPARCSDWLVPYSHIKLCYIFLQQTALYCITSWYLPSAGPISLTSQSLLNKKHFSLYCLLIPLFPTDLKHIIISSGILQIDPRRCQDILQNISVVKYLQDMAFPRQTGKTSSYCSIFVALLQQLKSPFTSALSFPLVICFLMLFLVWSVLETNYHRLSPRGLLIADCLRTTGPLHWLYFFRFLKDTQCHHPPVWYTWT